MSAATRPGASSGAACSLHRRGQAGNPPTYMERQSDSALWFQVHGQHQHGNELLVRRTGQLLECHEPLFAMIGDLTQTGADGPSAVRSGRPGLPPQYGRLARGGFEVGPRRAAGRMDRARILSRLGGRCPLRPGEQTRSFSARAGQTQTVRRDLDVALDPVTKIPPGFVSGEGESIR